jgi:hypothetical protein
MGFTEQQRVFEIEQMAEKLNWTKGLVSAVANRFEIVGASEPNLSKAYSKTKDLQPQTAAELITLMFRFTKMAAAFEPFTPRLDDPDQAKRLLEDFEAGKLIVSVTRAQGPDSLVYGVFLIENLVERNRLFQGIQNGEPSWGFPGAPIKDRLIADAAANILADMSHPCRVFSTSVRTTEAKIARSLLDLGFILEEKEQDNVA